MNTETFPIDLNALEPLKLDPVVSHLTDSEKSSLEHNIQLCRDAIVFFTALAGAKGLSGHTGGAYDTVPEVMILRAFIASGAPIVPIFYDEAGHRVATQYLLSCLLYTSPATDHQECDRACGGTEYDVIDAAQTLASQVDHIGAN